MTATLLETPLTAWHAAHGGRMVDFAGWSMPVQYTSIVAEHNATRNAIGLFDVSHMGRLRFFGPDTAKFLDHLLTRRVIDQGIGKIRYSLVCREDGGILDDVLAYRIDDAKSPYGMVVNASNREKILDWFSAHQSGYDVAIEDQTRDTAMIAVQGPKAIAALKSITAHDPSTLKYYTGAETKVLGSPTFVSRTGYTGEDGCELVCSASDALVIWEKLIDLAGDVGGMAAGLGCRDTLRLEAAMPLYGHELDETINPVQAGLDFAINLKDRHFIGKDPIEAMTTNGAPRVRIGLKVVGRRVPRQGYAIQLDGESVGVVTSGTVSPTIGCPIAMGYVGPSAAADGAMLSIDIRGTAEEAVVVPLPFYKKSY